MLLMLMIPMVSFAQKVTVKGTVSAADGPIIGATVKVKGAQAVAVTDIDGNYSIQVNVGQTLTFSYIGYESKEITVGNHQY